MYLAFVFILLSSCKKERVYEENLRIKHSEWIREDKAHFEFEIDDTTAIYEFYLNFRHGGGYPYRNLYLFTHTSSPSGKVAIDTAQMLLADNKGRWMGKGIGDIYDYQFKFKQGDLFRERGNYIVEIEQAMREKKLPEITDIGISIQKVNL